MGFWANFKAKRAHKGAQQQFEIDHLNWVRDVEIFNQIRDAFELAAKGEDAVSGSMRTQTKPSSRMRKCASVC